MELKSMKKGDIFRLVLLCCALAFCLVTGVLGLIKRNTNNAFMSLLSVLYVFIPTIAEKLFKFRIQNSLYVFILIYTICPLLGYAYNFYHLVHWWDDILHGFAGVIFAMLGAYLPYVLSKKKRCSVALCAFCAFFFSVAISGLWELWEFTSDSLFHTDMQKDTILNELPPSYVISDLLDGKVGELIPVDDVQIVVNGEAFNHYVDLGLIDSMRDVLVETAGAAIYTLIYVIVRGKYFVFVPVKKETALVLDAEPILETETDDEALDEAAISESIDEERDSNDIEN
ncbi:MAG: hypothetical protein E7364_00115 [Clostridiales bacterium]|nr:hypothetical protein [Clostridiales bacterium]